MTHCAAVNSMSGRAPDGCFRGETGPSNALNGIAAPRTKRMTTELGCSAPATRPRRPWASIAVALVAVALVLAAELWAFAEAPTTKSEVVSELNSTLADVVATSLLISPAD